MKYVVCSVYDKAVGAFMPPFYVRSRGEAIRSFMDACADPKHQFVRNSGDYTLFQISVFDDASGAYEWANEPQRVMSALEAVTAVQSTDPAVRS